MPLCTRLRPDVHDRQTSDALNAPYPTGGGIIIEFLYHHMVVTSEITATVTKNI